MLKSYKICLLGKSGVGKSALAMRIVYGAFCPTDSTIGSAYFTKVIANASGGIKLNIWDTAGQERYNTLIPMYTRGAHVILLCTTSPDLADLKSEIERYKLVGSDFETFIVVTKQDTIASHLVPDEFTDILMFAKHNDIPLYFTSAKTNTGVDDLLDQIKKSCHDLVPIAQNLSRTLEAPAPPPTQQSSSCGC